MAPYVASRLIQLLFVLIGVSVVVFVTMHLLPGDVAQLLLGEHATNCIFDGSTLYVTATKVPDLDAHQRTGTFWRVETDATGLALRPGQL